MLKRSVLILALLTAFSAFENGAPPKAGLTPDVEGALDHILASQMRGDLSFIASDLLEGRDTPSRGLDIAAEYIAAQFRGAGLEPGGDDGYFQTDRATVLEPDLTGFELTLSSGGRRLTADPQSVVLNLTGGLDLKDAPLIKVDLGKRTAAENLAPAQVEGRVVISQITDRASSSSGFAARLRRLKAAAWIVVDRSGDFTAAPAQGRLVDLERPPTGPPRITILGDSAAAFYAGLPAGASDGSVSIHVAALQRKTVPLHNIIGILRGSDPHLRDTCVMLTAHYDHVGMRPAGPGDRVFNGANDNGSGTVSVIEAARALALLKEHPRRSILFVTFFGEEKGLVGSRFYAHHPAWPIEKTVAQLNLEQVGRTDSTEGPQISNASLTGFDYSDLTDYVREAGGLTGVKIYKHPRNSDQYFSGSDNLGLAEVGVPAHTLAVTFDFPDYHAVGDEWQKIDFDNMAKVDRTIALAIFLLASSEHAPRWNEADPKTAPYVNAWNQQH
jgi:hypothetical protein